MTELEEIAKAIWTEAHGDNDPREPTWDTWPKDGRAASLAYADYSKDDFFRFARAAVKAISEPSEAMIEAGVNHRLTTCVSGSNNWPTDTSAMWRKMTDAILTEAPETKKPPEANEGSGLVG